MEKNTRNYDEIIKNLVNDFQENDNNCADRLLKIRKICIVSSSLNESDHKYDKIIDEADKVLKSLNTIIIQEFKKIKDLL